MSRKRSALASLGLRCDWPRGADADALMLPTRPRLATAVQVCHAALTICVAALVYRAADGALAGAALALLAVAPLLATLRGLASPSRTRAWAALLLVLYVGGTSVEVVATSGTARLASVVLVTAALELALLLALIRRSRALPRADHE
jgi:uncharacterized membrane protein